jgi:hypothetical protein
MKINRLYKAFWVLWVGSTQLLQYAHAQHTYIRTGGLSEHILDRLEIKSGSLANDYFHSTLKSYRRKAIANYIDSFPINTTELSQRDYENMAYLINDNFEWSAQKSTSARKPFLKHFYQKKAALFSVQGEDFNLVVNPVLYYQVSTEKKYSSGAAMINNRGIEIRGNVGRNIGFYTQVSDEIIRNYSWVEESIVPNGFNMPYVNFYKTNPSNGTYSYFASNAYVTANINPYMDLQFGHTTNFIGDGYRSLILGNNHPEYMNLRLNTRFWRINYTNIWGELRQRAFGRNNQARHYFATHHLSLNVSKNFNIGLFETTIYNRDSTGVDPRIELNYFNPVVFYKSVENGLNSVDKSVIGLNFKYNFLRKFSLYGQLVLTEFVFGELISQSGWVHNKYGAQIGLKSIDVAGVKNLDIQTEFNLARPFLYASYNTYQSFSNFNQNLAHPYGANFYEFVGIVRYQALKKLYLTGKFIFATYGNDTNGSNWGKDPKKDYDTHTSAEYGNFIGQGVATDFMTGELIGTYMLKHNLFLEARAGIRKVSSVLSTFNRDISYFTLGIRLNINDRQYDF